MIDIHHHCLPDVDDGPKSWDVAVAMCRMARDEGIEAIVATPHVLRGLWPRRSREELTDRLDTLRERCPDGPALHLGSEYYFAHDMVETLAAGETVLPLAGGRYVLIELAANGVPPMLEGPLYRAQLGGWIPVIAHPERNRGYQKQPELLAEHLARGAKAQITASSLTGAFGRAAQAAAERLLERNLVHFVATDAHDLERRPPAIAKALAALRGLVGDARTRSLTVENPLAVIQNRALPWDPELRQCEIPGFFTRIRSFLAGRKP